ncbi:UNC93-like protein like [Argiope bruennichi]|uniref:UNC93-like protein like n=1 Tax=Argiope bruennichi TaxID=94029 RepID=A0A8T0FWR6_ARGBR|nr:UNC93-like protein like [Argiope bruennichi]
MKFSRLRIIKNLTIISFSFVLLFTAYNGLSMLQSTMNKMGGVGTVSQAVVYISFGLSSLLLPNFIIKKLGTKNTLLFAMILYLPYIAANFYPMWITLIPSAVLIGIGASILWGSQCTYFNESSVIFCTLDEDGVVEILNHVGETSSIRTSSERLSQYSSPHQSTEELSSSNNNSKCGIVNCQLSIRNIKRKSFEELSRKDSNNSNKSEVNTDSLKRQLQAKISSEGIQNNACDSLKRQHQVTGQPDGIQNSKGDSLKRQYHAGQQTDDHMQQKKRQLSNINEEDISIIFKSKPLEVSKQILPQGISSLPSDAIPRKDTGDLEIFETYAAIDSANACFFGCHGLAYYSAQVWSNLMTYYVLHKHKSHNFSRIYSCSCGADFCDPEPECVNDDTDDITPDTRYMLTGLSVGLGVIAVLLILLFLDPLNKAKEPVTFSWKQVLATFNHSKKKEQLFLVPLSLYVGMAQGFYTADITKSYIACAWGTSHIGLVTVFYGLACALSSTVSGCLVQFMGRIPIFLIGQIGNIINYTFLLMWSPEVHHPFMFYLAAALWGIITGLFWSQLQAFYGVLFQGDEEAAFGSYYLYSSMGWTISFLYTVRLAHKIPKDIDSL